VTHALHLTTWHPWIDGVSGVFVVEQCAALRAAGLDIGLIFSRIAGLRAVSPDLIARGLPGFISTDRPVPTWGFKSWSIPGARAFVPSLNTFMLENRYGAYVGKRGQPDILHPHVALETGAAALRLANSNGIDFVITEHSSEILNGNLSANRREAARSVYDNARIVIAVSSVLAERISDISPRARIKVIGNSIRSSVFDLRRRTLRPDGRIRILSIAKLVANKRIHRVISSLTQLPDQLKCRIDHHIIGSGPELRRLQALANSGDVSTLFHGPLPHGAAMNILSTADLLVHASAYETFGMVLAEAAALGIPVVATRCGGPEEVVSDVAGVLVGVDDEPGLRDAIEGVLEDLEFWRGRSDEISRQAYLRFHESNVSALVAETYK